MNQLAAWYYDGHSSARRPVTLVLERSGMITVSGLEHPVRHTLNDVRISDRLASTPRMFHFQNGAKCEVADNDAVDAFLALHTRGRLAALIHSLENHWGYVLVAVVFTLGIAWGSIRYGIPALASVAVASVPLAADVSLGAQALETLDQHLLSDTALDQVRQNEVRSLFTTVAASTEQPLTLEFRAGGTLGANALALPSGVIVITDELIALTELDEEIIAVLAHEAGHLSHRHAMRSMIQHAGIATILLVLTGDISSLTGLAVGLPVFLVEASYSRAFERVRPRDPVRVQLESEISGTARESEPGRGCRRRSRFRRPHRRRPDSGSPQRSPSRPRNQR